MDGLRIHYLAAGDSGSPVLLLHGGGLDSASLTYRYSLGPLSRHHRVIAPDWPGYGKSDKPRIRYTTDYYVGFLGHLMEALGLERPSLVGISLGGAAALGFGLRWPERVDRLVLVDSHGLGKEIPWRALSYLLVRLPLVNELTWMILSRSRWMVRASLRNIIHDPRVVTDDLVEEVRRMLEEPGVGAAFRSWQRGEISWGGLRTNYLERLPELAAPTLILHGANDSLVPPAWAERAHRLIPNSELLMLPECGHWLPREKPEQFNRALSSFLDS